VDLISTPAGCQWDLYGVLERHGIDTPLFSLHSRESCGIGEFYDLVPLIHWCKEVGLSILQLLPLNDTGKDSSPYNAISSCALNPLHLSLNRLPGREKQLTLFQELEELRILNLAPFVDYARVNAAKTTWLKRYYAFMKDAISIQNFVQEHLWVRGYALFKALKDLHEWKSWEDWPEEHRHPQNFESLYNAFKEEASFHIFVQALCFRQMHDVKREAGKAGILLKGDIPILISPDSADVWLEPHLFHLDLSAGAPPDMYSKEGQYWGFPLFNWEAIAREDYRWWKQRLNVAQLFYHWYRIDHIVGFFRIWGIPRGKKALEGHFYPEDPKEWIAHGEKILRVMLSSVSMLPIGEDLGVIPPEVRQSLLQLGICGTRVMRWERDWHTPNHPFIPMDKYQKASMTTVSTHDSEQLKLWWINHPEEAKVFAEMKGWDYTYSLSDERYRQILWDSHHTTSLLHINLLQEYLTLFPELHSGNLEDERINIPSVISNRNWSFRYRPSIEQLTDHGGLKQLMRYLIQ